MAISPADKYYRAEVTPTSITALGASLRAAYRRPADAFGAKGNLVHASGYHRSRAWVLHSPDSRYGARDYSVQAAQDQGGDTNGLAAFDFTPGEWGSAQNRILMAQITGRVYAAARMRDPRVSALREFAGTLDGRNVVTFNCADGSLKSPFDSSHLDHVHGSFWRMYAAVDHSGLLAVLLGEEEDDMGLTPGEYTVLANTHDRTNAIVQNLPTYTVDGGKKAETNRLALAMAALQSEVALLRTAFTTLAGAITDAGGDVNVAAIMEALDAKLDELAREQRDAVADLGINEAAVRAGSDT